MFFTGLLLLRAVIEGLHSSWIFDKKRQRSLKRRETFKIRAMFAHLIPSILRNWLSHFYLEMNKTVFSGKQKSNLENISSTVKVWHGYLWLQKYLRSQNRSTWAASATAFAKHFSNNEIFRCWIGNISTILSFLLHCQLPAQTCTLWNHFFCIFCCNSLFPFSSFL